jgi:hypothetical protein
MQLTGLHLLLTYQCTFECDHCFVWGSPRQSGTMTLADIRHILAQARSLGGVEWIYFEGGEPFLYYPVLARAVEEAAGAGFKVGLVTNAYWALCVDDAEAWLRPLAGHVQDLSVSSDLFHYSEKLSRQSQFASAAARGMAIPTGIIAIGQPAADGDPARSGQLPDGESGVMYRGRAAVKLAGKAPPLPWSSFTTCPYEELAAPERVHVDPLGNLHVCQGVLVGNLYGQSLAEVCAGYVPGEHPVIGPLLRGGPGELVRQYGLAHGEGYADACHLCYEARVALRERFPAVLGPDQVYGTFEGSG